MVDVETGDDQPGFYLTCWERMNSFATRDGEEIIFTESRHVAVLINGFVLVLYTRLISEGGTKRESASQSDAQHILNRQ